MISGNTLRGFYPKGGSLVYHARPTGNAALSNRYVLRELAAILKQPGKNISQSLKSLGWGIGNWNGSCPIVEQDFPYFLTCMDNTPIWTCG